MLKRITSWSFRHRRIVVVAWIAILVAINLAAMTFGGENKQEFLSPGTDSKAAIDLLDERFPAQAGDTDLDRHPRRRRRDLARRASPSPNRSSNGSASCRTSSAVTAPWDPAGASQVSGDGTTGYATVQLDTHQRRASRSRWRPR